MRREANFQEPDGMATVGRRTARRSRLGGVSPLCVFAFTYFAAIGVAHGKDVSFSDQVQVAGADLDAMTRDGVDGYSIGDSEKVLGNRVSPLYQYLIYFYDTEGKAGLVHLSSPSSDYSSRFGIEDGTITNVSNALEPFRIAPGTGIPFWWELKYSLTGTVRGWAVTTRSDQVPPLYMLPVPGSQAGLTLHTEGNSSNVFSVTFNASLVDKLETPSPLILNYLSYSQRSSVITAVYLPGNTLANSIGLESHFFNAFDLSENPAIIRWGDYGRLRNYPFIAPFAEQVPTGPILVAFTFEGSSTAMIYLDGRPTTYHETNLPFAPLPEATLPTASEVLGLLNPPPWIMELTYDAALMGNPVDLTTDLDVALDRNHDGVIDAADRFSFSVEQEGKAP